MLSCSLVALLSVFSCSAPVEISPGDSEPSGPNTIVHGEIGTPNPPLTLTIQSQVLGQERRVYVQLPEGYERTETRYPVVVVLDGEWLFELVRANVRFASEYEVMDVTIPKMIVVGIEKTD